MDYSDKRKDSEDQVRTIVKDKLDRPIRDLRISVTDQCFLRCFYCMPKEIFGRAYRFSESSDLLSYDNIIKLVTAFAKCGVEKIRLTGGEPLLRPELPQLINAIRKIDGINDVALTTNGLLLEKYLPALSDAGLHRLNISMDAMADDILEKVAGKKIKAKQILNSIDAAREAGFPVKVNMVVTRGVNECQILPMAHYMKERGITLRFIEYMDVGNSNDWKREDVVTGEEIRNILSQKYSIGELEADYIGEVARRYRYTDCGTEVGFIESISKPFCGGCNRARISATGKLFTCLFSHSGIDLKPLLQKHDLKDEELFERISTIWQGRKDRYSEERFSAKTEIGMKAKAEMWQLGG
jgi:GTP 3',8-cyclase